MYAVWVISHSQDFPVHPLSCRSCTASECTTLCGPVLQVQRISKHGKKEKVDVWRTLSTAEEGLESESGDSPADHSTAKGAVCLKGQQEIHQSGLQAQTLPVVAQESQTTLKLHEWILENEAC